MSEPARAMLVRAVVVAGRELPAGELVWCHRDGGAIEIEHRGKRARVDEADVVACPVAAPTLDQLRALDACFGLPDDAFELEHRDDASAYSIARCTAHGRRFLRELRGGIGLFETTTLLDDGDATRSPDEIWRRYHAMSLDWLHHRGRTR